MPTHKIGFNTAVSVVIANMIGTGVFTSLGFQVMGLSSGFSILALWIVGGILALCGAFTYGELGSAFPENGGEYNYLSRLYHPAVGFLSGWVSVTVGFAAPIAASAVALARYVARIYPSVNTVALALTVIVLITLVHAVNLKAGSLFQRVFTVIKLLCIVVFITAGLLHSPAHAVSFAPGADVLRDIFSPAFAGSLIYVTYAYSGWNAAAYISGEIINAPRNLPRALLTGTLLVLVIYTLLNYVFLYTVPVAELRGVLEVGYVSAEKIFGASMGQFMGLVIALLLISTISAMVLAGPRVMQSMGRHVSGLRFFAISNHNNVPWVAIVFQSVLAMALVLTSSFESLITYVSFTLNLFTLLTVAGIFVLRYKFPQVKTSYKTPLYPLPPLLFLAIILWILINIVRERPTESVYGLLTVVAGLLIYFATHGKSKHTPPPTQDTA